MTTNPLMDYKMILFSVNEFVNLKSHLMLVKSNILKSWVTIGFRPVRLSCLLVVIGVPVKHYVKKMLLSPYRQLIDNYEESQYHL